MVSRLDAMVEAMEHPAFELTTEEAAAVLLAVAEARRDGYQPDRLCTGLLAVLARQLRDSDADADSDVCVDDGHEDEFDREDDGEQYGRLDPFSRTPDPCRDFPVKKMPAERKARVA
jgi:hypothetical protein